MIDFLMISTKTPKKGIIEIYPKFIIKKSSDLMIRGGDFYAVWVAMKLDLREPLKIDSQS